MNKNLQITAMATLLMLSTMATADAPIVQEVTTDERGGSWTVSVTLTHTDTGWDHYADGWEVLAPDGTSLGIRVIAHPHVAEQPFTRSLGSIKIPDGIDHILIRARDNVDGWFDSTFRFVLEN